MDTEAVRKTGGAALFELFDFMTSGEPGSLVIWGLLAYALWSAIFEGPWANDASLPGGWDSDCGDGGD